MGCITCVPQWVSAQALASPDSVALASADKVLTYRELETRANQLAQYLRTLGVRPDAVVALLMDRLPQAVIGMLGILKSGGAYLPLDAAYPADRLAFMLADAGVEVVVTDTDSKGRLPVGASKVIAVDGDRLQLEQFPSTNPSIEIDSNSLAYVIYTSGSTGEPKGVLITHSNLANLVEWHRGQFQIVPEDRASQIASLGFDAAVWEIWPYLSAGASIHFANETARAEPETLRDWLVEERINIGFVPTALAEHMLTLPWPASTSLRFLLTGADTLRRYPPSGLPFKLINNYGPTEGTVVSTSCMVPAEGPADQTPPIGWAIRNVQTYVLDQALRAVEQGAAGELFIGGAGVAAGYLNRPELTAEKFVRDPFRSDPQAKLYRTGDLARCLPDGQIAFLGRMDNQIKIRGYRIEPEEISAVLTRHPTVRSAVVRAWADSHGEKRLLAYVVSENATRVDHSELKTFMRARLPEYMVPAEFVWLERLPLTLNGKVDHGALPEPKSQPATTEEGALIEVRLSLLLSDLLGLQEVGREENFFMLGGHSLLGAQLLARIREVFGVSLTLRSLFQAATVASLSAAIEAKLPGQLAGQLVGTAK